MENKQTVEEYIWSKQFPDEEINYDDFYDWISENSYKAVYLALDYCNIYLKQKDGK